MCSSQPRGERGFNLIELMMSMSLATILFMAITVLYVQQGKVIEEQNDVIDMNREARFALDHLRRDLSALGSNATPNSDADPLVCPKPDTPLRALQVVTGGSYVASPELNPGVRPVAMTLFGSLDIRRRFRTTSIADKKVFLYDDGTTPLPKSQAEYDQIFTKDRWLRVSGSDGSQIYARIVGASAGDASVTVATPIPRQGEGQACGYQGFGGGYWVDVQGLVRYRLVADERPGAGKLKDGKAEEALLVRERLGQDGATVISQTILVENAVDFTVYDAFLGQNPAPGLIKLVHYLTADDVASDTGDGILGITVDAKPEQLRAISVKLSVRTAWPDRDLVHKPRQGLYAPLATYQLWNDGRGAHRVVSLGSRVFMPTMESRNL
jgi:prepilin-type N-terminal cleavage/methylation domain-containing protein